MAGPSASGRRDVLDQCHRQDVDRVVDTGTLCIAYAAFTDLDDDFRIIGTRWRRPCGRQASKLTGTATPHGGSSCTDSPGRSAGDSTPRPNATGLTPPPMAVRDGLEVEERPKQKAFGTALRRTSNPG